jgi:hypothetical protein
MIDKIYVIYVESDTTEGRTPQVLYKEMGFFTTEEEAWAVADTIPGIMGRKPNGSWKDSSMSDVTVKCIYKHNGNHLVRIAELKNIIVKAQEELTSLTKKNK